MTLMSTALLTCLLQMFEFVMYKKKPQNTTIPAQNIFSHHKILSLQNSQLCDNHRSYTSSFKTISLTVVFLIVWRGKEPDDTSPETEECDRGPTQPSSNSLPPHTLPGSHRRL